MKRRRSTTLFMLYGACSSRCSTARALAVFADEDGDRRTSTMERKSTSVILTENIATASAHPCGGCSPNNTIDESDHEVKAAKSFLTTWDMGYMGRRRIVRVSRGAWWGTQLNAVMHDKVRTFTPWLSLHRWK